MPILALLKPTMFKNFLIMHENGIKANQLLNGHLTFEFCSIKKSPATMNFK